jgi:hypothetical protein
MVNSTYLERDGIRPTNNTRKLATTLSKTERLIKLNTADGRTASNLRRAEAWRSNSRRAIVDALAQFKRNNPGAIPSAATVAQLAMVSQATVYRVASRADPELYRMISWRGSSKPRERGDTAKDLACALDINASLEQRIKLLEGELVRKETDCKFGRKRIAKLEEYLNDLLAQPTGPGRILPDQGGNRPAHLALVSNNDDHE